MEFWGITIRKSAATITQLASVTSLACIVVAGIRAPRTAAAPAPRAHVATTRPLPQFVRLSLLGAAIDSPGPALVFDARQRYFLERNGCSSDEKSLSLLPDDVVAYPFRHRQLVKKAVPFVKLPNVHAGAVRIGMTPAQLRAALGGPPSSSLDNSVLGRLTCIYTATISHAGKRWDYRAVYTFRHGFLWAVEYFLSATDQC